MKKKDKFAITEKKQIEGMAEFLTYASKELASSLDYETTLKNLANLIVPTLADWFTIDIIDEKGEIKLLTVNHVDPKKVKWAQEYRKNYPPDLQEQTGIGNVIKTGKSEMYPEITEAMLEASIKNTEQLKLLKKIGLRSIMIVPLTVFGKTRGAISFITTTESNKLYSPTDLQLVEDFARWAALALENARLYKEVQEAEARYQNLFYGLADAVLVFDSEGNYLDANPAASKLLGYSYEEILHNKVGDFSIAGLAQTKENFEKFKKIGKWNLEGKIKRKDSTIINVEGKATTVKLSNQTLYVSVIRNITQNKKREKDLEKILKELADIKFALDQSSIVVITDKNGVIQYVNNKFLEISKYSKEEVIGKTHRVINSKYYSKDFFRDLWDTIKSGQIWQGEIRNRAKDGSLYWVDTTITPLLDEEGEPVEFIAIRNDITQRKLVEQELSLRVKRQELITSLGEKALSGLDLEKLFNIAVEMLVDNLLVEFSKILQTLPHRKEAVFRAGVGWNLNVVMNKTIVPINNSSHIGYTFLSKKPTVVTDLPNEKRFVGTDVLREHHILSGVSGIIGDIAKPWGILAVHSIKKRKFTKDDVNFMQSIAHTLAMAIKRKELENQKDEFISIASHELKTPITTIKAFTQLMQKQAEKIDNKRFTNHLNKMEKQIDRLTVLVQDLLDVSKIQSGRLQYNEEIFDINILIKEIVDDMEMTTPEHTITFKSNSSKMVNADRYRMSQVLINLLSNAIKYSPEGRKIIVDLKGKKDEVLVSVRDFGIGIPKGNEQHIFDRFYRVHDKKRESYPGLGLGLYISCEIVKRYGGKMWVESEENKGSKFYFTLPIAEGSSINN